MTMSDKERKAYEAHMDDIMVQNDVLDTAKMEGRAEGCAEGRAEGELAKAIAIAKNLKSMGFSVADIIKATGLTDDEVMKL